MEGIQYVLPSNAKPFQKGVATAISYRLEIPLAEEMDPYTASAENLPYLAAHHSVDYWYDDWPESRKREIIAHYAGKHQTFTAEFLPELKGTKSGVPRYLYYADGEVIAKVTYPSKVVLGRSIIGRAPFNHPPFKARFLVKVETFKDPRAAVVGRAVLGRSVIKTPSREKLNRARAAMNTARAPHAEYTVSFAHKRIITIDDNIDIDGGFALGQYIDRTRL